MYKILLMGGTTFVSSSLAQYLISKGYTLDILTRGTKMPIYSGFANHIICDRKNPSLLNSELKNKDYDYIFDISAYTKTDVKLLLNAINRSTLKKYIFCSSGAVYVPSNCLINEDYERGPNINWGDYGLGKKEAEDFIMSSNIPYSIFRPTYIYGEENNLPRENFFKEMLLNNKTIKYPYGNDTKTQFLYIGDLVKVFESALFINKSGVYNITNPDIISWPELINTCGKILGIKPKLEKVDTNSAPARSYFPFRDVTYTLSIDKLIKEGLYIPKTSLKEGLKFLKNN